MARDNTFYMGVVFFWSPMLEGGDRLDVGHLMVEIGDSDILFGSAIRK